MVQSAMRNHTTMNCGLWPPVGSRCVAGRPAMSPSIPPTAGSASNTMTAKPTYIMTNSATFVMTPARNPPVNKKIPETTRPASRCTISGPPNTMCDNSPSMRTYGAGLTSRNVSPAPIRAAGRP